MDIQTRCGDRDSISYLQPEIAVDLFKQYRAMAPDSQSPEFVFPTLAGKVQTMVAANIQIPSSEWAKYFSNDRR